MKADPSRQMRMLDLQALDTRLAQIAHRRTTLPVLGELADNQRRQVSLEEEVVIQRTQESDIQREITKAEADVQQVRDRMDRDQARLDSGTGTVKELQGLQSEMESLTRRRSELEDVQLEVMERAEAISEQVTTTERARDEAAGHVQQLLAQRDDALAELDSEERQVRADRANIAPGLGEDLLAFYEKLRDQLGGLAAAPLSQRRCGGCGLEFNAAEIARFRSAPEDEILRCEECRRIVVRTPSSGL